MRDVRVRWAALARYLAKSAAAATTIWLLIYFASAPNVIHAVEDEFLYRMRYIRNPSVHMQRLEAERAEVLASPTEMKAIRESLRLE
jgi:hypothetical protein